MVKRVVKEFSVEYLQILDEEGNIDDSLVKTLSDDELKKMYEVMMYVQHFDQKAFTMQRQGRLGTYLQVNGQEACQVGAALAMTDDDILFPTYRETGMLLARKHPPVQILQYWDGDGRGLANTEGPRNFPMTIPICTQNPLAAGAAWAAKLQKKKQAVLVCMGDGATSRGDLHEAMNFAGVHSLPVVFFVQNNQFAISVPRTKQTHSETIAQKAIGYGFKGVQIDGNDVLGVYATVKEAMDKARDGQGPTLIEAMTYRLGDHSTSDDAKRYRSDDEVEHWKMKHPLIRFEKFLATKGLWTEQYKEELTAHVKEMVDEEVAAFEKIEDPPAEDIFNFVYAEPTKRQEEQKKEMFP